MALWTVKLTSWGTSVTPGSCESCRPKGPISFLFFSVILWVWWNKSKALQIILSVIYIIIIPLRPVGFLCPQDSLAAYMWFFLFFFKFRHIMTSTVRERKPGPSSPTSPTGQRASPRTWAWIKLYTLFGWGWWDLVRAAGLLVFLEWVISPRTFLGHQYR